MRNTKKGFATGREYGRTVSYRAGRDLYAAERDQNFGARSAVPHEVTDALDELRLALDDMRLTNNERRVASNALTQIANAESPPAATATAVRDLAGILTGVGAVLKAGTTIGDSMAKIVAWVGPAVAGLVAG